jgi:hypothetical protein
LSEGAGGEAAGSGGSDLQIVAAFPEPVEDFAVAGGRVTWRWAVDFGGSGAHARGQELALALHFLKVE